MTNNDQFEAAVKDLFDVKEFKFVTTDAEDQNYTLYVMHRK